MSQETEKKYDDVAVWFEQNLNRYSIVDPEARWRFLTKCVENLLVINAKLIEDLQKLEGRGKMLYLPSGLHYTGDLTKVG